jgi:Cu/Ag efflux protein CusF
MSRIKTLQIGNHLSRTTRGTPWLAMGIKNMIAFIVCAALLAIAACGGPDGNNSSATPSGPAAAVQTNSYEGVGVVKSVNPKEPAIEIDHEDIEGLMPAMQMEFPVTDASLLNGLAVNDRIDFTIQNNAGVMKVTAIKKK